MLRIILSVFIGAVIVGEFWILLFESQVCLFSCPTYFSVSPALNFTCDWAEARMATKAAYKSFSSAVVEAEIGLHVGLSGINVTLKGQSLVFLSLQLHSCRQKPFWLIEAKNELFFFCPFETWLLAGMSINVFFFQGTPVVQFNETIDYNEMFSWRGSIEEEYEAALEKGLPNPILYIAEKFTSSSTCRLVSQHRSSGRYASAALWYSEGRSRQDRAENRSGADPNTSQQVGVLFLVA